MPFHRFYRYDFAVTQVFIEMTDRYYGVVISAHIVEYTPTSVVQLLNDTRKPFFVDPMTFVFARDPEAVTKKGRVRKSYRNLAAEYGEPFSTFNARTPLLPSQFSDQNGALNDNLIREICERLLNFQRNKCKIDTSFPKYFQLLKKGSLLASVSPAFLVAPYFYAKNYGDDWYAISLRCARIARDLKGYDKLYPVICISKDLLWDRTLLSNIVRDYGGFDGYLIWVDDLDEQNISGTQLGGLKYLVTALAGSGSPVYSLYGGYLLDLLSKFGLSGYASGICYGESRGVDARGGGAGNRYYVPAAHLKISENLANAFFAESARNLGLMCPCDICVKAREGLDASLTASKYVDLFFEEMGFLDYRRHFVDVKFRELLELEGMTNDQIARSIEHDIAALSLIDKFRDFPSELTPTHLRNWRELFV